MQNIEETILQTIELKPDRIAFYSYAHVPWTSLQTIELKPDRIAFYSYAHVPWTSKAQRLFDEGDLPPAEEKIKLYVKGKELLTQHGYCDIGMDHFALLHDELHKVRVNGSLHRNFMGYTTQHSGMLIGLGVSAISDTGNAYAQNEKTLHDYYERIDNGELAIRKGYFLSGEDLHFKQYILNIICTGRTVFRKTDFDFLQEYCFPKLKMFAKDELLVFNETGLVLTERGQHFVRNICSALDLHLQQHALKELTFSKSV